MISSVWATFNVSCMKTPLMTPTAAKPNTPLNRIVNMLKAGLRSSCKSRATGTQVPSVSWNIVSIPPRLRTSCMIMICLGYWMPYHCIKCVCVCVYIGTCSSLGDEKTGLERCRSRLYHSIPKVNICVHTLAWPNCHPFWSQTQNWLKQAEKLRGNVPKYSKSFRCTSVSVWIAWSELLCKKLIANWPNLGSPEMMGQLDVLLQVNHGISASSSETEEKDNMRIIIWIHLRVYAGWPLLWSKYIH